MNITLGVTGSISAYKSIELLRLLIKEDHEVKVVLTKGALKFVRPELFSYLGASDVFSPEDDFSFPHKSTTALAGNVLHVELAKWSEKLVIAPLSANSLSNLINANAGDLLSSLFLAWEKQKPILVFPAMNTHMYHHPFVQKNLRQLGELKNLFLGPTQVGELACGDTGEGKLLETDKIFQLIKSLNPCLSDKHNSTKFKHILISTGATVAPLDKVRFLTNASSGKTSIPFITEALSRGHRVTVVAGIYATNSLELFTDHPNFSLERVRTTQEMLEAVQGVFASCDTYISMAAIGDIQFDFIDSKLKKAQLGSSLKIIQSPDILKEMLSRKRANQTIIGFAAESNLTDEVLLEKLKRKPVDMLIGTEVDSGLTGQSTVKGFGTDQATYRFVDHQQIITASQILSKKQLVQFVAQKHF